MAVVSNDTEYIAGTSQLSGPQIRSRLDTVVSSGYDAASAIVTDILANRAVTVLPSLAPQGAPGTQSAILPVILHPWESVMPSSPSWSALMAVHNTSTLPNRPSECDSPPPTPSWLNSSAMFDPHLWPEHYCLLRCSAAQDWNAARIMAHCPFLAVSVADSVLLLRELQALRQLAQVLDEEKETVERWLQLQLQVARGIRYGLQNKVRLPLASEQGGGTADWGGGGSLQGFEADNSYFTDGYFAAPLSASKVAAPIKPNLVSGLVTAAGASAVTVLPVLEAQQQQEQGGTNDDGGSDDSIGGPTWSQQVAAVLLSGSFMPPPFAPSLSRLKGGSAPSTPRGYGGASLDFNATERAQGPVWLRLNWMLSAAAAAASMEGVAGGLISASVQAVCNTTFPGGVITELYAADSGAPLPNSFLGGTDSGAALAWLLVGPSPPPFAVPGRPSAIVGLAIAVVVELIFVMLVGVACIGIGVQFMRDIAVGGGQGRVRADWQCLFYQQGPWAG